jgi:hypothetical protein
VLGAVVVHLQAQRGAGLDHDALDLEARAAVDAVVPAPGPVHLAVQRVLAALLGAEPADDLAHILAAAAVGHQHGVGRLHHHHVLQAHRAHQAAGGVHQGVAAVGDQRVARVALPCASRSARPATRPPRRPRSFQPASSATMRMSILAAGAAFHHGVVHRLRRHGMRTLPSRAAQTVASVARAAQAVVAGPAMSGRKRSSAAIQVLARSTNMPAFQK